MSRLDGKVAFITGGARGQGRELAVTFARAGADAVVCDIPGRPFDGAYPLARGDDLRETERLVCETGRRCLVVEADVRSQAELDAAVALALERFGAIDVLLANAGVLHERPFWEISDDEWSTEIGVNLTGAWHSAKAVAPSMIERRTGVILFTSSVMAIQGGANAAHYVASKAGVVGLMKSIAAELAPYGIRVNALLPGGVDTPMSYHGTGGAEREAYLARTRSWYALRGHAAMPASAVASAALWLTAEGDYVTGTTLVIDGGGSLLPRSNPTAAE